MTPWTGRPGGAALDAVARSNVASDRKRPQVPLMKEVTDEKKKNRHATIDAICRRSKKRTGIGIERSRDVAIATSSALYATASCDPLFSPCCDGRFLRLACGRCFVATFLRSLASLAVACHWLAMVLPRFGGNPIPHNHLLGCWASRRTDNR